MARTELTVYEVPRAGLVDPSATTGTVDGHFFDNPGGDRVLLEFNNSSLSSRIVTLETPATYRGQNVEDATITLPGSASRFKVSEIDSGLFTRPSGSTNAGTVYLDYPLGLHADVSVRAFLVQ